MSDKDEATAVPAEEGAPVAPAVDTAGANAEEPDIHAVREQLEAALGEAQEHREQFMRAAAELENVRRRAARDLENAHRFAVEKFARDILAVKDSMEMGLSAEGDGAEAASEGFKATLRQLVACLERYGVQEIEAEGAVFDPELHEAMATQPTDDASPDTVLTVVQKGYRIHDRLLRPARVIIARASESA